MSKNWMQVNNRFSPEYLNGVKNFLNFAYVRVGVDDNIPCPCVVCNNAYKYNRKVVERHLIINGIEKSYDPWVYHGETFGSDKHGKVEDESHNNNEKEQNNLDELLNDIFRGPYGEDFGVTDSSPNNGEAEKFVRLTKDAEKELYPGCKRFSKLSFIVKLLHIMSMNKWTQKSFNMLLQFLTELLPDGNHVPNSFYEAKKVLQDLGLNYTKIHACKNDCVLFWGPNESKVACPTCEESRWKSEKANGDKIPHKILRYFPIKPRLQRLFLNKDIASEMRWHKEKRVEEANILRHPADGIAWKEFDKINDSFARDPRNVRLALSTDGFNPFSNMSSSYSMWPVMLVTYNLPPWKAMKESFFFLSLLIPGPRSPGNDIDVFLQPLIKDLIDLWANGIETYDASTNSMFNLRAALLWTISDFPAYANLSGWSTKGKLACPICNAETTSMRLCNGRKTCYMGHRRFLPKDHKWRDNKSSFDGNKEHRPPPKVLSGDDVLSQIKKIRPVTLGKGKNGTRKRKREPCELNWTKCSIFFKLPYWKSSLLRHNLDVMHIEKNVAEAILSMLLNIPGKTKDTIHSRLDLQRLGIKKELHPIMRGDKLVMPAASFSLSSEERKHICEYWASLKLPDGYSSNFSRCINSIDGRMIGLKSHDYHIFLQRLLALAVRSYLPKGVCEPLIELGAFFKGLCSKSLKVDILEQLGESMVVTLCKLERIFPPSLFDVMVHLPVHLVQEALLGGPVQDRWMYFFERQMHSFKEDVRNKAQPEGSIAEAYILKESLSFCSIYLHGVETKHNRLERNYDGRDYTEGFNVFAYNGRLPTNFDHKTLNETERRKAHLYILNNCNGIQQFVEEHIKLLNTESTLKVYERHAERFPKWFDMRVSELEKQNPSQVSKQLRALSWGPDRRVLCYKRCIINGYRFHTKDLEMCRKTQNSGICVMAEHEGEEIDFYGVLTDIIEMEYHGQIKVVLFKCDWWNLGPEKGIVGIRKDNYGLTSVNTAKTWYKDDPYILASQAGQVYYVPDLVLGNAWKVVIKNTPRDHFDFPEHVEEDLNGDKDPYQENVITDDFRPKEVDNNVIQLRRHDVPATEIDDNIQLDGLDYEDINEDDILSEDSSEEEMMSFEEDDNDDIFS